MWRAKERLLEVKDWCIIIINNTKGHNKRKLTSRGIRAPHPHPHPLLFLWKYICYVLYSLVGHFWSVRVK